MTFLRYMLCLLGLLLAAPLLVLILFVLHLPLTTSGVFYLISSSVLLIGLVSAPFFPKRFVYIIAIGSIGLALVFGVRLVTSQLSSDINMVTLPAGKGPRWLGSILDEQDALILGEELFHTIGGDSNREHEGLVPAFQSVYAEMRTQGAFPSPVVDTYLYLQRPNAFDAVIIKPDQQPTFGVIFLHGYMGNVTAQCWAIAQAVKELGGLTVCPSTEWTGQWWLPGGREILKRTFSHLREQGISRIYLGGFSNGGFSIGRLTSDLGTEPGLSGLIFIDGFMNGANVRELGLPVLMIEGTKDERVPPVVAQGFAAEVGDLGTYVEIESDHFLIIKQPRAIQNAIQSWLSQQIIQ